MTGYDSPEDLIRDRQDVGQQSYCDPAKWQEFKRLIGETGFVTNFEYDVKRRDGSIFSVSRTPASSAILSVTVSTTKAASRTLRNGSARKQRAIGSCRSSMPRQIW
jgi:PAS domain-containing protein